MTDEIQQGRGNLLLWLLLSFAPSLVLAVVCLVPDEPQFQWMFLHPLAALGWAYLFVGNRPDARRWASHVGEAATRRTLVSVALWGGIGFTLNVVPSAVVLGSLVRFGP